MVTVRTLAAIPELRLSVRVGGEDSDDGTLLDHTISRVYSTELPDPSRYLSGSEFVVSGLLWWQGTDDGESFVAALAEYDAAALVASAADMGGRLPEELIAACRRHQVALLEADPELSFAVITERVVLALATERGETVLGTHRRLLAAATGEGGLDALMRSGAAELGSGCQVRTATGRVVAGEVGREPAGGTSVAVPSHSARSLIGWSVVVGAAGTPGGSTGSEGRRAIAEEIAAMVGLERTRAEQARRERDDAARPLLHALARGTPTATELGTQLSAAGIATDVRLRILIVTMVDGGSGRAAPPDAFTEGLLDEVLAELGSQGPIATVDGEAYALATAPTEWPPDAVARANAVLDAVQPWRRGGRAVVAISGPTGTAGLRGAAEEARQALALGRHRDSGPSARGEVVAGDEIAAHHLLLANTPDELRRTLRRRLLGPVEDYDAVRGGELLRSLRVFLERSGSWRAAAGELHVHVNTLRYRIGRVESLLGRDLADFTTRVDLYLALQIEGG